MKKIKALHPINAAAQSQGTKRPVTSLSPHDLTGIRNSGSAAAAVDLAGWLRRVLRK